MNQLIQERISKSDEKFLSEEDIQLLKKARTKQGRLLLSGYLPLIGIYFYIIAKGPSVLNTGPSIRYITINDDTQSMFWRIAPYFVIFMFIITSIYFLKLYMKTIHPLTKDLKSNLKRQIYFKPQKNAMSFFNKYYLSTPLYENQQIEIGLENFEKINNETELCLEIAATSFYVLRLRNGNQIIEFWD
ncbi:MAG: hypothetical protein JST09_02935 [Bacteroidetes bacterium]|nr:hypothetical protein [Bacteroidota bacterium]MBS1607763.1 hypothetical protein [Bacteroidota bacterium]